MTIEPYRIFRIIFMYFVLYIEKQVCHVGFVEIFVYRIILSFFGARIDFIIIFILLLFINQFDVVAT